MESKRTPHGSKVAPLVCNDQVCPPPAPRGATSQSAETERFVDDCLEILLQLFALYGFERDGYRIAPTREHWLRSVASVESSVGGAVKFVKYKLAAFAAAWLGQELPPSPLLGVVDNPKVLLGGRADRFARLICKSRTSHDAFGFISSVLYSKKGMPRPPKSMVKIAEAKTEKTLTSPPAEHKSFPPYAGLAWGDFPEDTKRQVHEDAMSDPHFTWAVVERELRRTVDEVLAGQTFGLEDRLRPLFPSTSANFNMSRSALGAVGEVLRPENAFLFAGLRDETNPVAWTPRRPEEHIGLNNELEYSVDLTVLEARFGILYERLLKAAAAEPANVEALGLPEALKVRVISKGPPLTYFVLKSLQKKLWSVLAAHPTFVLTGQPVSAALLAAQLGTLQQDEAFCSVDYESATDLLHPRVSEIIADQVSLVLGLREEERALFIRALTGHIFPSGPQRSGQLMGSIISFPVLCLANAAICRYAVEQSGRPSTLLRDLALLVNGDDAVFRANSLARHLWSRCSAFVGLKPSVGKVYYAKSFLNINSNFFRVSAGEGEMVYEFVPFVNLGLLYGVKRSGDRQGLLDDQGSSLGNLSRELWRMTPPELRERLLDRFRKVHWEQLSKYNIPWGVPEWLGGLGIAGTAVRPLDLQLARAMVADGVSAAPFRAAAPWKVREMAMASAPDMVHGVLTAERSEVYERVLGLTGVGLLFTKDAGRPGFQDQLYDLQKQSASQQLRARERLWAKRLKQGKIYPRGRHVSVDNYTGTPGSHQPPVTEAHEPSFDSDDPFNHLPAWAHLVTPVATGPLVSELASLRVGWKPKSARSTWRILGPSTVAEVFGE